jgi:hypothetical protein
MTTMFNTEQGWGSFVLVEYLQGGIPFVRDSFPHPYAPSSSIPKVDDATISGLDTVASQAAVTPKPLMPPLEDRKAPNTNPPVKYIRDAVAWIGIYSATWVRARSDAYASGNKFTWTSDLSTDAEGDAMYQGLRDGWAAGLAEREAVLAGTPIQTTAVDNTSADTDDAREQTDDAGFSTRQAGHGRRLEHAGSLIQINEDGTLFIDTRRLPDEGMNGADVYLQAGANLQALANGSVILGLRNAARAVTLWDDEGSLKGVKSILLSIIGAMEASAGHTHLMMCSNYAPGIPGGKTETASDWHNPNRTWTEGDQGRSTKVRAK